MFFRCWLFLGRICHSHNVVIYGVFGILYILHLIIVCILHVIFYVSFIEGGNVTGLSSYFVARSQWGQESLRGQSSSYHHEDFLGETCPKNQKFNTRNVILLRRRICQWKIVKSKATNFSTLIMKASFRQVRRSTLLGLLVASGLPAAAVGKLGNHLSDFLNHIYVITKWLEQSSIFLGGFPMLHCLV